MGNRMSSQVLPILPDLYNLSRYISPGVGPPTSQDANYFATPFHSYHTCGLVGRDRLRDVLEYGLVDRDKLRDVLEYGPVGRGSLRDVLECGLVGRDRLRDVLEYGLVGRDRLREYGLVGRDRLRDVLEYGPVGQDRLRDVCGQSNVQSSSSNLARPVQPI